jgi:hypothetical protein
VSLDVSGLTGTFRIYHASYSTGTNIDSTGTLVFNIVGESGGTRLNILGNNGSAVTLDNISVKEVLFDQPDGTLTLFEHPDDVPRVEYDADGNRLGLLVEESRTNLFTESEELSLKDHNMDTTDNAVIAPDRTQTASFCKPDTSSSEHFIDDAGVTTGTNYAISCFAKQGPGDYLLAFRGSGLGGNPPRFNLATGTIDNEGASSVWSDVKIQEIGNGWYRCSAVGNPNQSTPLRFQITESDGNGSFAGDGTSGLYIWGCQIEQASFPTSYIKSNSGSTTTRSADVASIPVADFGYNQSEGTVVVEAKTFSNAEANHGDFALTDSGTSADLSSGSRTGSSVAGSYSTWYRTAGTTQANLVRTSAVEDNVFYKAGFCYKANDFAQSVDGGSILSDSSGTVPSRNSVVLIGDNYYGKLNGHIKSIKYFPRRLTNAQLVDLTS